MTKKHVYTLIVLVVVVEILIWLLAASVSNVSAQDGATPAFPTRLYACRTDRADIIEIQFHNFSVLGDTYWFLGDAGAVNPDTPDVLYVQALTSYGNDQTNFVVVGEAIIGNQDYSVELVGNGDTPLCGTGEWPVTMSGVDFSVLPTQPTPQQHISSAPVVEPPVVAVVQSTGRICTIQYPKIILVCQ